MRDGIGMKIKNNQGKYPLKKVALKYLPEDLLFRKKQGFSIPVKEWMKTRFAEHIHDMVSEPGHPLWNYLRKDTVSQWMSNHQQGTEEHGARLWLILTLGLWLSNNMIAQDKVKLT